MNLFKNTVEKITIVFGLLLFSQLAIAQCYDDFFAFWKTDDGKFIKLIKYDCQRNIRGETAIGDKHVTFPGVHVYEQRIFKIVNYEYQHDSTTNENKTIKRSFEFKVLAVDKQSMTIRPVSEEMKSLFGSKDVLLFNEDFVPYDRLVLDSLYFASFNFLNVLQISKAGEMKLEKKVPDRRNKKRDYSATLGEKQFEELRKLVIRSQITSMSNCELTGSCSDCRPFKLKIFYDGKYTYYHRGMFQDSVIPLYRFLNKTIVETKWKKIKKNASKQRKRPVSGSHGSQPSDL